MPKSRYSKAPAKGTKGRSFLRAAMSAEGACWTDHYVSRGQGWKVSNSLLNYGGWDVRSFRNAQGEVRYRCVGRYRWSGGYRSFIQP